MTSRLFEFISTAMADATDATIAALQRDFTHEMFDWAPKKVL